MLTAYFPLYHAIENTANQNAGKQLYIRQYSTEPSHRSVQFSCITPNLPILRCIFYGMIQNSYATLSRDITNIKYKFTVVYCESVNLIGYIIVFYLLIVNTYASVHITFEPFQTVLLYVLLDIFSFHAMRLR